MAGRSKQSKNKEAGVDGIVGLAFIFVDRAAERADLKPSVFFRAFWICSWTAKWRVVPKVGALIITSLLLICCNWQNARDKWIAQHEPAPHDFSADTYKAVTNLQTDIKKPEPSPEDLKQEIRSFLERINPQILRVVDSGGSEVPVFHVFAFCPIGASNIPFQKVQAV